MTSFLKKYSIVGQTILVMSIFGMLFASLLAIFFEFSNPVILKSEAEAKQRLLLQVIGGKEYDNNLDTDFIDIPPNAYLKNKKMAKHMLQGTKIKSGLLFWNLERLMVIVAILFYWLESARMEKLLVQE